MGVMGFISSAKSRFRDAQVRKQEALVVAETEKLRMERDRQAKLVKAMSEKARLTKDVGNMREFTEKHKAMTNVQKFGKGLAHVMNQVKDKKKDMKSIGIGVPKNKIGSGFSQETRNVFGNKPLNTGGGGSFTFGPTEKKPMQQKKRQVIINL